MFAELLNMKYIKIALFDKKASIMMNYRYETFVFNAELDLDFTVKLPCSKFSKGIYHNWIYNLGIYNLVVQIF